MTKGSFRDLPGIRPNLEWFPENRLAKQKVEVLVAAAWLTWRVDLRAAEAVAAALWRYRSFFIIIIISTDSSYFVPFSHKY